MLIINDQVAIDEDELDFSYARSSGPGGQNVNKVETKVILRFSVRDTASLTDAQKRRIQEKLSTRISRDGVLRVVSQRHRTRAANQNAATDRFIELLADALKVAKPRRKRGIPASVRRRRLDDKRRRARVKELRSRPADD